MRNYILAGLLLLAPTVGWAQGNTNTVPPACTVANIATCAPAVEGTVVRMTLGADETDCTTDGGTTTVVCEYDGSAWVAVGSGGSVWTGANGETITNAADGTFTFTRDEAGTVTLTSADDDTTAAMAVVPGGASALTLGSADTGAQTINTNGVILEIDTNGTNRMSIENSSSGWPILDFRDYGSSTDDDMYHGEIYVNCTTASTNAEDCDMYFSTTEAGENTLRMTIDGDGGTVVAPETASGGNAGRLFEFVAIPRIAPFSINPGKTNTGTTNVDFGDSETPNADWVATTNVTDSTTAITYRKGTTALKLEVGASPEDGNGADCALTTGNQDWSDITDATFGLWMRCTQTTGGDEWVLEITDSVAGATEVAIPALTVADHWTWLEVPIGAVADASKDVITSIALDLTATGATNFAAGGDCFFDGMWKWDTANENALSLDVYEEGVFSVMSIVKATGGDRIPKLEVEDTDYFVHYEAGDDFLVSITDLSADVLWGLGALEP
jgi:hypothetical protein